MVSLFCLFVFLDEDEEFAEDVVQDDDDDGDDYFGEQPLDAEQRVREPVCREEGRVSFTGYILLCNYK